MLSCAVMFESLQSAGVEFFTGVPDSLLKNFCAYVSEHANADSHVITANEGNAIALACGYHLATGRCPLVYMQNSGLGNAVNPLISLADRSVYGIPMLLMIGWRGQPGTRDEPQHLKQGLITGDLLDAMGIQYEVCSSDMTNATSQCATLVAESLRAQTPTALLVSKGTFETYTPTRSDDRSLELVRESALQWLLEHLQPRDVVVSTTGFTSRELWECRQASASEQPDFLTVGSMGHASQIAVGVAMHRPDRTVYCLDGDGAALMHMGSMAINGALNQRNFRHVLFNNGAHESVGGQQTVGHHTDFCAIAKACGYASVSSAHSIAGLARAFESQAQQAGPSFLEIRIKQGTRPNLGRPSISPLDNKIRFIDYLTNE